jgi:hypothetical protein
LVQQASYRARRGEWLSEDRRAFFPANEAFIAPVSLWGSHTLKE